MEGPELGHDYGHKMPYKDYETCFLASSQPFEKEHPGSQLAGTLFGVPKRPVHSCFAQDGTATRFESVDRD